MPESDPALGQIVGRKLQSDAIPGKNSNSIPPETTGEVGEHYPFLIQLNTEQAAWKLLQYRSCNFDVVLFTHPISSPKGAVYTHQRPKRRPSANDYTLRAQGFPETGRGFESTAAQDRFTPSSESLPVKSDVETRAGTEAMLGAVVAGAPALIVNFHPERFSL
jgi:hypothetical protein